MGTVGEMNGAGTQGTLSVPAGWFDDPGGSGQLRYWTGSAWSVSLRAAPQPGTDGRGTTGAAGLDHDETGLGPTAFSNTNDVTAHSTRREADRIVEVLETSAGLTLTELARATGLSRTETQLGIDELKRVRQVVEVQDVPKRYLHANRAALRHASTDASNGPPPPAAVAGQPPAWGLTGAAWPRAAAPTLTFGEAVSRGIDRALDFSGRSTRPEYWWFALFAALVSVGALVIAAIPGIGIVLAVLVWVAVGIAQLAAGVRRLHDTGRSGAWIFWLSIAPTLVQLMAIPALDSESYGTALALYLGGALVGAVAGIVLLVMLVMPGDPQRNQYGEPSP